MNEITDIQRPAHTPKQTTPKTSAEMASDRTGATSEPTLNSMFIIGLAFTGITLMGLSLVTWRLSGAGWFCAFGLLTGGLSLSSSTALLLGQLTRAGDAIYSHSRYKKIPHTS